MQNKAFVARLLYRGLSACEMVQRTQLDDVSESTHDNESDTDGAGDLNELALIRCMCVSIQL